MRAAKEKGRRGGVAGRVGWIGGVLLLVAGLVLGLVWWGGGGEGRHAYALAPESALPARLRAAPPGVREAYRFALANRETLRQIPCYCGCGAEHPSNYECYVKGTRPDGTVIFDEMSLG